MTLPLTVREPASTTTSIKLRTVHLVLAAPMCELRVCQGSKRTGGTCSLSRDQDLLSSVWDASFSVCRARGGASPSRPRRRLASTAYVLRVPLWPKANPREPSRWRGAYDARGGAHIQGATAKSRVPRHLIN